MSEIRKEIKTILKKYQIEAKFKVFYVSFADLARDGKYFVEFKDIRFIELNKRIKIIDEIKNKGWEIS
jgi:hypothetical protein